jgi:hypothetical protein
MARSANLEFFAAKADQRAVLDFLFSSTDVRVFESYSEYDAELREFRSTDELAATFPIGTDPHGNGTAVLLQLWSPSVMRDLTIRRFNHLRPHRVVSPLTTWDARRTSSLAFCWSRSRHSLA